MMGLILVVALIAIGFAAGYGTRSLISRKRHADYLKLQPYISPTLKPRQRSSDENTKAQRAASDPPAIDGRRTNHDITRSFQELSIHGSKPTRPASGKLHLVQAEPDGGSLRSGNAEASLEELVALLQRREQEG